ncbi:MAG: FG-GAP-like repeat-containing protein, partial [Candidatus Cloacimonadaceae bacterium]|nr:FG-GAP-like repeat-containing protein [Candidatus Cloacimonadaceae bacterium]
MKTAVLIFVLISAIICLFGEAPYWQWATSASVSSANGSVESRAIANDSMGNSYVVGSFSSIATFGAYTINSGSDQTSDIFVAKLDNSGEYVWVVQAGGSFSDNGNDIALDSTGSIVITGSFRGTASFGDISLTSTYYSFYPGYGSLTEDIFVAKLDSNGNWIWVASVVGTSLNDIGNAIAVDNNSNVYITGKFEDTATFGTTSLTVSGGQFDTDAFVAKLNSNGSWIWARKAGGISYEEGYDVVIDNESNVVITGYFHATCSFGSYSLVCTSDGEFDIFVAKLDSSGNWLWASKAGGNSSDYGFSLVSDTDNNIYVTGRYENNAVFGIIDVSGSNVFVGKMNSGGTWLWVKTLPLDWGHKRKNITIDDQDNVYYTGTFENEEVIFDNIAVYNIGGRNSYVAKLSNSGNWIWVKQAGSYTENSYISSSSISVDGDETVYLCGSYYGSAYFGNVNLDANGMFVTMLNMTPQPEFILSSYIIDYGAQSSSSVTEFDLVLRNNGAVSGEITDITITGSTFFYADLINRNPIQIPYSLAAGDSISLTIHYLPEQMGYHEAMLNITINNYWVLPILLKGYLSYFIDSGVILQSAWGMSIVWGDYDNDGDLDLFNNGLILRNDGNGIFTDVSAGLPTGCAGSWGDYDNDGDLDLAIIGYFGAEHICRIYRNEGNDIFIDINAGLSGVRPGSATWGDYDNDGDLDLLVTGWDNYHIPADNTTWSRSITRIYANNGDGTFFDINADFNAGHQFLHGYDKSNWADVDNDGDLDVFVTGFALPERASVSLVFRNDGNNLFTTINTGLSGIDYGETTFGDYDNDGDLDVLQSGYSGGSNTSITTIYRNEGNFVFTNISADLVGGTSSAWGDYDNDGDLDLLLTGSDFFGEGFSFLYRNDGNGVFTEIQAGLLGVSYGTAIWGDYDNDGNLDILLTGSINLMEIIKIYRNEITIANQSPTFPSVSYDMSNIMIYSYGSYDDTTPSNAIHYNFRIGYTPGGCEIVSPMALDSGLRKLCAYGNSYTGQYVLQDVTPDTTIYVTAQALDNSFFGSAFSPEIQVVTPALHLTYPNGGEVLQAGTISHVDWADNSVKELNVQISIDNGLTWSDVNSTPVASAPGTYEYTVPDIVSSQCLIKMVWAKDDSYYDISDTNFAISSHVESYAVINETQIQFGNSWINHTATREFSIGNEGMQPLSVSLFVGAGVFSVSTTNRETIATRASVMYERSISADRNEVTITIPPMTTETVYVHFLPTAIQNYSRNLFIETNAPNLPTLIIPLSGTGYILFAEFTANPATGDVPLEVSFINQSVAGISRSLWDFGDGISSEETNPVHTFTQEGLYNVQLTVWDNYFSTSVTHAVNVIAHPLLTCNQSAGHSFTKSYLNELSAYFDVILQSSGTDTLFVTNIHW